MQPKRQRVALESPFYSTFHRLECVNIRWSASSTNFDRIVWADSYMSPTKPLCKSRTARQRSIVLEALDLPEIVRNPINIPGLTGGLVKQNEWRRELIRDWTHLPYVVGNIIVAYTFPSVEEIADEGYLGNDILFRHGHLIWSDTSYTAVSDGFHWCCHNADVQWIEGIIDMIDRFDWFTFIPVHLLCIVTRFEAKTAGRIISQIIQRMDNIPDEDTPGTITSQFRFLTQATRYEVVAMSIYDLRVDPDLTNIISRLIEVH
jgi:hypothetical protein